jgi:uncharacterized membrane protein SpoIIM required for sporulation
MPIVEDFIARKKTDWEQLDTLVKRAQSQGLTSLSAQEINDLGRLYRSSTSDLAVARRDYPKHQVSQYLNDLVARSHSSIYSSRSYQSYSVWRFFTHTFPQTFRATWPYTLVSFLMFFLPALYGYINAYLDPTGAASLLPGIESVITQIQNQEEWWLFINQENSAASAQIMTNNITVAINAFAGGILFGIYTFYILYLNGLMLGIIAGAAHSLSFASKLWGFVAAHGAIELSVIFIAGGAGMQLGWSLLRPGLYTRSTALYLAAQRAVIIILGCIPLLVIAGLIEGFISPSPLPNYVKYSISIISGLLLYGYLIFSGRTNNQSKTA